LPKANSVEAQEGMVELSVDVLCLPTPWVSGEWRDTLPLDPRQRHSFPRTGDPADRRVLLLLLIVLKPSGKDHDNGKLATQVDFSRR
jgi:hypothetical protein